METRVYSWGDGRPWHSYAAYCRRHFGGRVRKIAVDAGLSCPNRDGTIGSEGGTVCDNRAVTPSYRSPRESPLPMVESQTEIGRTMTTSNPADAGPRQPSC